MEPEQVKSTKKSEISRLCHRIYFKLDKKDRKKETIESYRKHYGDAYSDGVLYASNLTGLHPGVLSELKDKSDELTVNPKEVDRAIILKQLMNFYLDKKIMPTTREMFDALQGQLPLYMNIPSFRKQLALMDFMWKNVKNKFFVIERPEVTYERYKFLKCVLEYHERNRPIYFVDKLTYMYKRFHNIINPVFHPKNSATAVYASSKKVTLYKTVGYIDQTELKNFLYDILFPNLTEHSLIVLKNNCYCEKYVVSNPTLESTKRDMIEWLDRSNVPYSDSMTKAELFSLIQKFTNKDQNLYVADDIIKANGHNVIRIPDHIEMLTPTKLFFDLVQDSFEDFGKGKLLPQGLMFQIFNTINEELLTQFYERVINEYKWLYEGDIMVDEVLDSLISKMATRNVEEKEDSDIPSDSED